MKEKEQQRVFNSSCRLWTPLEREVDLAKSDRFEEYDKPLRSEDLDSILEFIGYMQKAQSNSAFISHNADVGINRLYDQFNQRAEWEYQLYDLREQRKLCSRPTYIENGIL
ncbi:hypothetical protein M407DRAFT_243089 [Tulasnella calospora MUT 4182]|uniref:Uncharacterized protein n=1 Tax=Tulasnella calospora MUT 4182 TaxID=1051891 RepID=A0A0C3QL26_9AGAM|nr:hypothetical protein M407DRAFT_243089 [Tulasnella calospora MUT 4182]